MTDILASFPTELGWGALLVLLVRALVLQAPRIVDAVARGLAERETARRLQEQTKLTEAETDRADAEERRDLTGKLRALELRVAEQERTCAEEIASSHAMHEHTREQMDIERARCDRQLAAMRREMDEKIAAIESGHSPTRTA